MLETIRKYWIGFLVLALVFLHASIVGIIRYQASLAKKDISCEVPLGEYTAYRTKNDAPVEMTLHAIVPQKHRMKSRQLIELNAAQVRQALEEHLRQFDSRHLADPYMTDLRTQLLDILTQMLGASSVEDVLVTEIRPLGTNRDGLEFISNAPRPEPRRLVATLRGEAGAEQTEESDDLHGDPEESGEHQESAHSEQTDHATPEKERSQHKPENSSSSKKSSKSSSHGQPAAKH
ncbi:MAG: hypothetical protein KGQ51_00490 [Planctomycetes bacterium]|jgi:hypothetical protein|nr:hypothetical protein [Planctomycetota bacterium]